MIYGAFKALEGKSRKELADKAHLQMKRARLREETTARRSFKKLVKRSASSMAVRSSEALSGSTSLERETNRKFLGTGISSY